MALGEGLICSLFMIILKGWTLELDYASCHHQDGSLTLHEIVIGHLHWGGSLTRHASSNRAQHDGQLEFDQTSGLIDPGNSRNRLTRNGV